MPNRALPYDQPSHPAKRAPVHTIPARMSLRGAVAIILSAVCFGVGYGLLSRIEVAWELFLFYGVLAGIGYSTHDVVTLSTITIHCWKIEVLLLPAEIPRVCWPQGTENCTGV